MRLYIVCNPKKNTFVCRTDSKAIHCFAEVENAQEAAARTGGNVEVMACDLGGDNLKASLENYLVMLIRRWKVAKRLSDFALTRWIKQEVTQDVKLAFIAKEESKRPFCQCPR